MAPVMAMIADARIPKITSNLGLGLGLGLEFDDLRRKNEELESKLREREDREEKLRKELERTRERLRLVEEAEEMLCSQLGDFEAEAVTQARAFHRRIKDLTEQLNEAQRIIGSISEVKAR